MKIFNDIFSKYHEIMKSMPIVWISDTNICIKIDILINYFCFCQTLKLRQSFSKNRSIIDLDIVTVTEGKFGLSFPKFLDFTKEFYDGHTKWFFFWCLFSFFE
jgi:hypothetical protein